MIFSRDRILTTHVGSLPRNESLSDLLIQREAGERYDTAQFEAEMEKAIRHVVNKQKDAGIDIGNDGEQVGSRQCYGLGVHAALRDRIESVPRLSRVICHGPTKTLPTSGGTRPRAASPAVAWRSAASAVSA